MGFYPFFKKGIKKRCYWCLEEDSTKLSKDHLPPDRIFPEHDREGLQLITATICDNCKQLHGRLGEDDSDFVCHMLLWQFLSSQNPLLKEKLESCLKHSRLARGRDIIDIEILTIHPSSGGTAQYPILRGGREVILRVLDNIARGIYYRMRGEIIPTLVMPETEFQPIDSFKALGNPLAIQSPCVVKKEVFAWKPILYEDGEVRFLCWEFKFYSLQPLPIYYSYTL